MQQTFSSEHAPTVWRIIPSLEFLVKRWETMVDQPRFCEVKEAIKEGIISFKKWYQKVDDTSSAYFICLGKSPFNPSLYSLITAFKVLDPNVKDLYCRRRWDPNQYESGIKRLEEVVSLNTYLFNQGLIDVYSSTNITHRLCLSPCLSLLLL